MDAQAPLDGRTVTLLFQVKLTPPKDTPVGHTDIGAALAYELRKRGKAALMEIVKGEGHDVTINTTHVVY